VSGRLSLLIRINNILNNTETQAIEDVFVATMAATLTRFELRNIISIQLVINPNRRRQLSTSSQEKTVHWDFEITMPKTSGETSDSIADELKSLETTKRENFASNFVTFSSQNSNMLVQDLGSILDSLGLIVNDKSSSDDNTTIIIVVVAICVLVVLIAAYVFYTKRGEAERGGDNLGDDEEFRQEILMVASERGEYESPLMNERNEKENTVSKEKDTKKERNSETGIVPSFI
jgi:hypothetical protein